MGQTDGLPHSGRQGEKERDGEGAASLLCPVLIRCHAQILQTLDTTLLNGAAKLEKLTPRQADSIYERQQLSWRRRPRCKRDETRLRLDVQCVTNFNALSLRAPFGQGKKADPETAAQETNALGRTHGGLTAREHGHTIDVT